jgi:Protein of unknown function (DUF4038)/Putative collagen-binding domain of a collagenase
VLDELARNPSGSDALIGQLHRLDRCLKWPPGALAGRRSAIRLPIPLVVALIILGSMADAIGATNAQTDAIGSPPGSSAEPRKTHLAVASARNEAVPAFPLAVRPGDRYLVDAAGKPFLIHGDTAWSLIAQLTREEVDLYLEDRHARGFNTILVSLIEAKFATDAPANAYGELPFHNQSFETFAALAGLLPFETVRKYGTLAATLFTDYSAPNEGYFAHADWVLRRAEEKGFLVLLTPSYTGYNGGAEGWYRAMIMNGADRLRQYGEFLVRRYRHFDNIVWVHAGDYDPPRKELVRAIAEVIRTFDPRALHTAHGAPETAAIEYWPDESWLHINNVYTYGPVCPSVLEQYARPERMPFFLIESAYENEHQMTERRLRAQAYHAVLCGAAGQIFGNNPVWHFDGPGLHPALATWQEALDSRGAQSMTHLGRLLAGMPWWLFEPDSDHTLLTDGIGPEDQRAVAARTSDKSLAIVYVPASREFTVDLNELAGPNVTARWFDPAHGQFSTVSGSPFPAAGPRRFNPEPSNGSGADDWVLVLESRS